jgi:hypothetical protein
VYRFQLNGADHVIAYSLVDDNAGITVVPVGSSNTTESGGTATFTAVLDAMPTADVTLHLNSSNAAEGVVWPATLTFTPADWNVAQTTTVTGVDDLVVDGDVTNHITVSATSLDLNYDGNTVDVPVTNVDEDVAGFMLGKTTATVCEPNAADTVTLALTAAPLTNVVFSVTSGDASEVTVEPGTLTFTPADWNVPQTVILTAVDDTIVDGPQIRTVTVAMVAAVSDDAWDSLPDRTLTVTALDNDGPGFTLSKPTATVSEPNTGDTVTVVLTAAPLTNVVFSVTGGDPSEVAVAPGMLTFTPADWNVPQAVTLTAGDDTVVDGPQISTVTVAVVAAVSDDAWDALPGRTLTVTTVDDDAAGITVSPISGNTTEDGGTATFTIVLGSQPTAVVTIGLSSTNTEEGWFWPDSASFTPVNWSVVRTVTVHGVDDDLLDGPVAYAILTDPAVSTDPKYAGLKPADVPLENWDDDAAGFTLGKTSALVSEDGDTDAFTVVLDAQPQSDVVLNVTSSNTCEVTANSATLIFTPATWYVAQTVVIAGVDDSLRDGDQTTEVTLSVRAEDSDGQFATVPDQTVLVTTTDTGYHGLAERTRTERRR